MTENDLTSCRLGQLSEGQIAVLRRVAELKSSKEIARELAISPHTVDKRISRILAILGVSSRADAARAYLNAAVKGADTRPLAYQPLVYQSSSLPSEPFAAYPGSSSGERNPVDDGGMPTLREIQARYFADIPNEPKQTSWSMVPFWASQRNELTPKQRAIAIVAIMFLSILALSILVSVAESLSRLV